MPPGVTQALCPPQAMRRNKMRAFTEKMNAPESRHNHHQVQKTAPQRNISDSGAPHLDSVVQDQVPQQIRINRMPGMSLTSPGFPGHLV